MHITYVTGNVLDTGAQYILHGCNAQGKMNSGVAKAIRERYPFAFDVYEKRHLHFPLQVGEIIVAYPSNHESDGKVYSHTIINGIIQKYYGYDGSKYLSEEGLISVINKVDFMIAHKHENPEYPIEVAMPRIGADRAGGDWETIAAIIEKHSLHFQPVVYTLPEDLAKYSRPIDLSTIT